MKKIKNNFRTDDVRCTRILRLPTSGTFDKHVATKRKHLSLKHLIMFHYANVKSS